MNKEELKKCDCCSEMTDDIGEYQERHYVVIGKGGYFRNGKLGYLCKGCYKRFRKIDDKAYRQLKGILIGILAIIVLPLVLLSFFCP